MNEGTLPHIKTYEIQTTPSAPLNKPQIKLKKKQNKTKKQKENKKKQFRRHKTTHGEEFPY